MPSSLTSTPRAWASCSRPASSRSCCTFSARHAGRRRRPWSNVRLWRGLGGEREARRNWRPPRRSLLLALQLAFVAVAVLALAGPTLLRPAEGEHLIVVLDASASLGATDVVPTRF